MPQNEWQTKSDDWRNGWRYGQGDDTIPAKLDSKEFADGYRYAIENPFGPCYTVVATTGGKRVR